MQYVWRPLAVSGVASRALLHVHSCPTRRSFLDCPDGDGRLTGPDAVTFFQRSGLTREQLAKVWAQADYTRRGFLDLPAFAKAMDLIALAQIGLPLTQDSYRQAKATGIKPPRMAGLESTTMPGTPANDNPFMSQQVDAIEDWVMLF